MKKATFISVLLFLSFDGLGNVSAQQWTVYTTADGLAENRIQDIREDKTGYLWVTPIFHGVSRYDGAHFHNLNTDEGLVSNNIYVTHVDRAGNLWFVTDHGVSRYDGVKFENFSAADGFVDALVSFILEDRRGHFWFATDHGVSRYDGVRFENFSAADGFVDAPVNFILEDRRGHFWFATDHGVSRYDGVRFENFSAADGFVDAPVNFILEDRRGHFWFGTEEGVYEYTKENLQFQSVDEIAGNSIRVILEDKEGRLWFGTESGVSQYDGRFHNFKEMVGSHILSMTQDSRGNLWFGTRTGISRYNGKAFQHFTEIDGASLNFVRSIWEDNDENLWFGTANGLFKYTLENLHPFDKADGLAGNSVRAILKDEEGNVWFGTENGVSQYDGRFHNFMVGHRILSMLKDSEGNLWIGTDAGIYKLSEVSSEARAPDGSGAGRSIGTKSRESGNFTPINNVKTAVIAILEDAARNFLWLATSEGVGVYHKTAPFRESSTFQLVFPIETVSEMFRDSRGNLWIGSMTAGIYKYDGKDLKHYTEADGLGLTPITWILETRDGAILVGLQHDGVCRYDSNDDSFKPFTREPATVALEDPEGNLWFGTYTGLMKKLKNRPIDETQWLTTAHGLISDTVKSIVSDRAGNLWVGTDKGVSKYDRENFSNISLEGHFSRGAIETIFEDQWGAMWFITKEEGVFRYTPPTKETRPRIHLTHIAVNGMYQKNFERLRVPVTGRITFEYQAISFKTNPEKMRYTYSYTTEGRPADWKPVPNNERRVHYPLNGLDPGRYQFQVRAIDQDLYASTPATVHLEVYQPFYRASLFVGSMFFVGICSLSGCVYFVIQFNRQRQEARRLHAHHARELTAAHQMQMGLLPARPPQIEGFDIAGICLPATEVGGDSFTYLWLDEAETQLGIVLMDVTGHGMKAAAITFLASGILRAESKYGTSPGEILSNMNQRLAEALPRNTFVAASFALINTHDKKLTHFNAGIPQPILLREGQSVKLHIQGGLPLGCSLPTEHVGNFVPLCAGDVLLFLTDGLLEAKDAHGRMYEECRMEPFLHTFARKQRSAQEWLDAILADVRTYTTSQEQRDDLTLVVVKVL